MPVGFTGFGFPESHVQSFAHLVYASAWLAGGIVFMTLEHETGIINVVCSPQVFRRHRGLAVDSQALLISGRLERADGVASVRATRLRRLPVPGRVRARDSR